MKGVFRGTCSQHFLEGATTVVPMVHSQMDMTAYVLLGKLISHSYLATGILQGALPL